MRQTEKGEGAVIWPSEGWVFRKQEGVRVRVCVCVRVRVCMCMCVRVRVCVCISA